MEVIGADIEVFNFLIRFSRTTYKRRICSAKAMKGCLAALNFAQDRAPKKLETSYFDERALLTSKKSNKVL